MSWFRSKPEISTLRGPSGRDEAPRYGYSMKTLGMDCDGWRVLCSRMQDFKTVVDNELDVTITPPPVSSLTVLTENKTWQDLPGV
jgi:hypothetical protein